MERGYHRDEDGNGRFDALEEVVKGVKLEVAVACGERAPGEWARDVCGNRRVKGCHGGEFTGEHCLTLGSSCDLRTVSPSVKIG